MAPSILIESQSTDANSRSVGALGKSADVSVSEVYELPLTPDPSNAKEPNILAELLYRAAATWSQCTLYSGAPLQPKTISYAQLYALAKAKAPVVYDVAAKHQRSSELPLVFLHFENLEDNIVWFWATILAGLSPVISTPLPANNEQRKKHLNHLATLLKGPIVLTTKKLLSEVQGVRGLDNLSTVEWLDGRITHNLAPIKSGSGSNPPIFMLTSGSSGNAKAVELQSSQILAAVKGKSGHMDSKESDTFLNWIGFDHVACVTECHIHAMYLGANQIHVPAADVIVNPPLFLNLINEHRVTASFAPNFFLARLVQALDEKPVPIDSLDLSCLRRIISGGEVNVVDTVVRVTKALRRLGGPDNVIYPGFGMTETCAGSIYSPKCPTYDVGRNHEFGSLGYPVKGLQMRVVKESGEPASPNETGFLHITGDVVFNKYYNNPTATAESFTEDGWFITGDKAHIDENGYLSIAGREKEVINLNGVKYAPHDIEVALDETLGGQEGTGIAASFTAVFSVRPLNSGREEICVLYHPVFPIDNVDTRIRVGAAIVRIVGERTGARPKHVIPLPKALLPKSSLGKLSRPKLQSSFEKGGFAAYEDRLNPEIKKRRAEMCQPPTTEMEKLVMRELFGLLGPVDDDEPIGVDTSIFDFGMTSVDLFKLVQQIKSKEGGSREGLSVGTLLTNPTIRGIASAIDEIDRGSAEYVPIVPLQTDGTKTPLFLIHPGSGDVLVFVALSKYFPDRPIYGIRTKSLYSGDEYFKAYDEMAETYITELRKIQPEGPYALAGYSLGSSIAFEVAKRLESDNQKIGFLGILDSPPHIRCLIAHLDFIDVLTNVAYFLELITEEYALAETIPLKEKGDDEALDIILACAPPERLQALSIDRTRLRKITEVTHSFGKAGRYYDPEGSVSAMDVFWVTPLLAVAKDRQEWMDLHLSKWVDFSRETPKFHECDGLHSKMLNADYVDGFAKRLRSVMQARGI